MLIGLVPAFNEEKTIIDILCRLEKYVDYIIIINDGSFDKTDFLISHWISGKENIHYLKLPRNRGMAYALLQGFNFIKNEYKNGRLSNNDAVVTIDADAQHNPDEIKHIYEYYNRCNLDVLITKRDFSSYPKYRIYGNKLMSLIASYLGKFKFEDIECGFKILRVSFVIESLNYYYGFRYSCAGEIGIIAKLLRYKLDNAYPIQVSYYRNRGPNFLDPFVNLLFYFRAYLKVKWHQYVGKKSG